ncbi:putative mitochondrial import receptor subunit TOM7-like protein, partial [Triplophysa rosa]
HPQSKLREKEVLQNTDTFTDLNKTRNQIDTLTSRTYLCATHIRHSKDRTILLLLSFVM